MERQGGPDRRDPSPRGRLRRQFYSFPIGVTIATAAALLGTVTLIFPAINRDAAITLLLPDWALNMWLIVYTAGGLFVIAGMLIERPSLEAAGWCFLGGAYFANAYAAIAVRGSVGTGVGMLLAIALGAAIRAVVLVRLNPSGGGGNAGR